MAFRSECSRWGGRCRCSRTQSPSSFLVCGRGGTSGALCCCIAAPPTVPFVRAVTSEMWHRVRTGRRSSRKAPGIVRTLQILRGSGRSSPQCCCSLYRPTDRATTPAAMQEICPGSSLLPLSASPASLPPAVIYTMMRHPFESGWEDRNDENDWALGRPRRPAGAGRAVGIHARNGTIAITFVRNAERRMADIWWRPQEHEVFAPRPDQRRELQQARSRVAVQDRQPRPPA
jgi:hypothetical protein